ncbi:hypothetical protein [Arthrobacter sp.]|uniref:hypothetical protein n=1 Tax=Arthrobacter sp. TaxID=1667 RepID=UPI002811CCC5|nr:hypothetical protein [Arthrobacter sp.]
MNARLQPLNRADIEDAFDAAMSRHAKGFGSSVAALHWQGPQEPALYMYGSDFAVMQERLAPFLQDYPLCQQSRVARIA